MADIGLTDVLRPTGCRVLALRKEDTSDGLPSQVHAVFEFDMEGSTVRRCRMVIGPGLVGQDVFEQLWNAIPDTPQVILDAAQDKCPKALLKVAFDAATDYVEPEA